MFSLISPCTDKNNFGAEVKPLFDVPTHKFSFIHFITIHKMLFPENSFFILKIFQHWWKREFHGSQNFLIFPVRWGTMSKKKNCQRSPSSNLVFLQSLFFPPTSRLWWRVLCPEMLEASARASARHQKFHFISPPPHLSPYRSTHIIVNFHLCHKEHLSWIHWRLNK